jgi:hypothetical protein
MVIPYEKVRLFTRTDEENEANTPCTKKKKVQASFQWSFTFILPESYATNFTAS